MRYELLSSGQRRLIIFCQFHFVDFFPIIQLLLVASVCRSIIHKLAIVGIFEAKPPSELGQPTGIHILRLSWRLRFLGTHILSRIGNRHEFGYTNPRNVVLSLKFVSAVFLNRFRGGEVTVFVRIYLLYKLRTFTGCSDHQCTGAGHIIQITNVFESQLCPCPQILLQPFHVLIDRHMLRPLGHTLRSLMRHKRISRLADLDSFVICGVIQRAPFFEGVVSNTAYVFNPVDINACFFKHFLRKSGIPLPQLLVSQFCTWHIFLLAI